MVIGFYPSIIAAKMPNTKQCFRKRVASILQCFLLPIDAKTDKEDEDDEDLRIPVQPNNSLVLVHQSERQKRLLERFIFFLLRSRIF